MIQNSLEAKTELPRRLELAQRTAARKVGEKIQWLRLRN